MLAVLSLPAFWLTRLYVALSVLNTALVSCFATETQAYRIIEASRAGGFWCVLALSLVATVAVLDVLVNDLLPDSFSLHRTRRYRHFIYMAMALGLVSISYIVAKQMDGLTMLHPRLLLDALIAVTVAFLDVFAKHRLP